MVSSTVRLSSRCIAVVLAGALTFAPPLAHAQIDNLPRLGDAGGEIVCFGTPDDVKAHGSSHTGKALREYDAVLGLGGVRAEERLPLPLGEGWGEGAALQTTLLAGRRAASSA